MKIIAIGDIHGSPDWKYIINQSFDKVLFIGDYFDSLEISLQNQLSNFKDILKFKIENEDKVVLLIGNHDYHYLSYVDDHYTGFQAIGQHAIRDLVENAINAELMDMCFIHNDIIFTHAGVSKTWCKNNDIDLDNLQMSINDRFKYKPLSFKFTKGENRDIYGNDVTQPPIWIRPSSLLLDRLDNYRQVVGHTTVDSIVTINSITMIDALNTNSQYLKIYGDKFVSLKLVN